MDLLLLCYQPNAEFPLSSFFPPFPFLSPRKGRKKLFWVAVKQWRFLMTLGSRKWARKFAISVCDRISWCRASLSFLGKWLFSETKTVILIYDAMKSICQKEDGFKGLTAWERKGPVLLSGHIVSHLLKE